MLQRTKIPEKDKKSLLNGKCPFQEITCHIYRFLSGEVAVGYQYMFTEQDPN